MTSSASISTQSATGKPFDPHAAAEIALDPLGELLRHGGHLAGRAARGDHHMIGDVGFPAERDGDDVDGLVVVERTKHEIVKRLGPFDGSVGLRSGFRFGQTASFLASAAASRRRAGPWGGTISWRFRANRDWRRGGRWRMSDRAASSAARARAVSTPSSSEPWPRAGRSDAASPRRVPSGRRHHSRAGSTTAIGTSARDPPPVAPAVELGEIVGAHQPDEAAVRVAADEARAACRRCSACRARARSRSPGSARRGPCGGPRRGARRAAPCPPPA